MERLTEKVLGFVQLKACGNDFCKETCEERDEEKSCKNCPIQKAFEKLAIYEELEEQGLLLRLPCKVGDSIYSVIEDGLTIVELKFSLDFYARRKNDIGKTVFLTQAEAEHKLKEMNGNHGIAEQKAESKE